MIPHEHHACLALGAAIATMSYRRKEGAFKLAVSKSLPDWKIIILINSITNTQGAVTYYLAFATFCHYNYHVRIGPIVKLSQNTQTSTVKIHLVRCSDRPRD
jgi:hypothetical protein